MRKMEKRKIFCSDQNCYPFCKDLRAVCIVLSIWKLLGNGCLAFIESGELHHSVPELHSGYSMLVSCNLFGVLSCLSALYGAIHCEPISLIICICCEVAEIALTLCYCGLVFNYMFSKNDIDLGLVENEILFFCLAITWFAFLIYVYKLYKHLKSDKKEQKFSSPQRLRF